MRREVPEVHIRKLLTPNPLDGYFQVGFWFYVRSKTGLAGSFLRVPEPFPFPVKGRSLSGPFPEFKIALPLNIQKEIA